MPEPAIDVRGLRKSYGSFEAVRGIDLHIEEGEVFSLLGPNGAGKTTTVEILEGHRARSAGEVNVLGHDPGRREHAFKEKIGIVLQETGIERFLTVEEVIEQFRGFYPNPRPLEEIIDVVGLQEKRKDLVRRLSGGQQRRLDVAIGLAGDPRLLFLDEPTTGFDPTARRNAWRMVQNLRDLGKTVFLTTHYMDEAQNLADRVAIIAGGRIVAQGTPQQLAQRSQGRTKISFTVPEALRGTAPVDAEPDPFGRVQVQTSTPTEVLNRVTSWAVQNGIELDDLSVTRPTLEDVYLELTAEATEPSSTGTAA